MSNDDLESTIEQLISMRGNLRLNAEESRVAGMLLAKLKEKYGFSDKKIEQMTGGAWKVPTIKHHTRGVRTTTSLIPNESLDTFAEMNAVGLNLQMVKQAVEMKKSLEQQGVALDDISKVISLIRYAGMSLENFITIVKEVRNSKIPIADLGQTYSNRKVLEALNIDNKKLGELIEAVRKAGNFDDTLNAIASFGSLKAINAAIQTKSSAEQVLDSEVGVLEKRKQSIQAELDIYQQLQRKGFNLDSLGKIIESSAVYGEPTQVIKAINQYGSLTNINKDIEKKTSEALIAAANLAKLQTDHQHLSELIAMCDKLLKLGFSIPAIQRIYNLAKQYGEPLEVLKAIDKFGRIPELEEKIIKANQERDQELENGKKIEARMTDYEKIKAQRDEAIRDLVGVKAKARETLKLIFGELGKPSEHRHYEQDLLNSDLPEIIENVVEEEVVKRLKTSYHNELIAIFQNAVKHQVNRILERWPKVMGVKTPEKLERIRRKQFADPFIALRGEWQFNCNKCNYEHTLKLVATSDILAILKNKYAEAPPAFWHGALEGRHTIIVSLEEIIKLYLKRRD